MRFNWLHKFRASRSHEEQAEAERAAEGRRGSIATVGRLTLSVSGWTRSWLAYAGALVLTR